MGSSRTVKKRCTDCKRVIGGTAGKMQWCDCGGELIEIKYRPKGQRTRGR